MERSHSCSNFAARSVAQLQAEPPLATSSDNLPQSCGSHSMSHFPPNKPLRKRRKLQRQQSVHADDVPMDCECAYAADLEENADADADADADMHDEVPRLLPSKHAAALLQRHISRCSSNSNSSCRCLRHEDSFDSSSTAPEMSPQAVRQHRFSSLLLRDSSVSMQSDSSRYSSVDSLLESRKPDPEAILINLGFGPVGTEDMLSRIPKRFLKPSKVPGIDTEAFVKRLQLASSLADSSALGYRGLTSSSDQPPSSIVAKIMQRFEVNNQRKKSMGNIEHTIR
ncbi:hypothetical protein KR093_004261 [Drosophila rubida]|uniref:ITPR-interacting domain-containing protein n=1 Tax=Drosophila rubida TaxID=30044 RepID=A0AAD4JZ30_9MUSC|nr:hypothetical protein KR093_004261 [Drosophila rubida]